MQVLTFEGVYHTNGINKVRNRNLEGVMHTALSIWGLNSVPDSCSESRMLRMEAILSAVAGLTVSWSNIFSRDPSSFTSRSITTENHKKNMLYRSVEWQEAIRWHHPVTTGDPTPNVTLKCFCIKCQMDTRVEGQTSKCDLNWQLSWGMKSVWNTAYRLLQQLTGTRHLSSTKSLDSFSLSLGVKHSFTLFHCWSLKSSSIFL